MRLRLEPLVVGLVLLAGLLLLGAFGAAGRNTVATAPDLARRLEPPSSRHPFGTDALGRDVLARTALGVRTSLRIAVLAACVALLVGAVVGTAAGLRGGMTDALLMRAVDILYALPFVCLVLYLLAVLRDFEPTLRAIGIDRTTIVFVAVGLTTWLTPARMVRAEVRSLAHRPFVLASRALGCRRLQLVRGHVLPHAAPTLLVALTLAVPQILLYEAFLSFLGLGVEEPAVSLGRLAAEGTEALTPLTRPWWLVAFPGGALSLLVFAANLVGDGLRDLLARSPHAFGERAR